MYFALCDVVCVFVKFFVLEWSVRAFCFNYSKTSL